jgi:2-polyprenyl-3-methyl-5-hydroxy-6-metoxy-1,4-benzoquinol methylase
MNSDYVKGVNKTYSKTFSKRQFIPKILPKYIEKDKSILDFGAGLDAFGTMALREKGYKVTAYDIGMNFNPAIHDSKALSRKYDVIFCSNVINVQPSGAAIMRLLTSLKKRLKTGGKIIFNYPASPRKSNVTVSDIDTYVRRHFSQVSRIASSPPTWMCVK